MNTIRLQVKHWWPLHAMAVAFSILLLYYLQILKPPIYINTTHSMPVGIYLTVPFGEVKRGDYVIFFMPEHIKPQIDGRRWALQYNVPIVKRVMGISNDQFTVTDREITINGQYIGPVFLEDSEGLSMPRLRGTFRIEQGMILPISDYSNRSFDGRYFGTIPVSEIKAKVIPLLTF